MIVRFLDGPSKATQLELERTPIYLRVVIDSKGAVDALDQLDDVAQDDERIYVYKAANRVHVCRRGKGQRSGWEEWYSMLAMQPADAEVRTMEAWSMFVKSIIESENPVSGNV